MLIRQSKNSYIRCTANYGYITNQLTCYDRTYDKIGADFLQRINRTPQDVNNIIDDLFRNYDDVSYDEIKDDFMEFANSLAKDCFIVMGETIEELNNKDKDFTYAIDNPKVLKDNFYQATEEKVSESTEDFFLKEVQGRPLISSLQFELSSRCNERCIHCYIPNEKKNTGFDMPLQKVKAVIDEFSEMGGNTRNTFWRRSFSS